MLALGWGTGTRGGSPPEVKAVSVPVFVNLEICRLSTSEVLIEVEFTTCVYRGECAYVLWTSVLYCVILKKILIKGPFSV